MGVSLTFLIEQEPYVREQNDGSPKGSTGKRSSSVSRRSVWNRVSAIHWRNQFRAVSDIHSNDGRTRPNQFDIASSWIEYRATVGIVGTAGFFYGFGLMLIHLFGGTL